MDSGEVFAWFGYAAGVAGAFTVGVVAAPLFRGDPGLRSRAVLALLAGACVLGGATGLPR